MLIDCEKPVMYTNTDQKGWARGYDTPGTLLHEHNIILINTHILPHCYAS